MKKYLLNCIILISILVNSPTLFSQELQAYKNAVTFGLTHSLNNTTLHGDFPDNSYMNRIETTNTIGRITPDIGINVDYYFNHRFSLQVEAIYASMGCYLETNTTLYNEIGKIEGYSSQRIVLDYIKMPMAINFYPKEVFYLNGGGYVSTLISSRERAVDGTEDELGYKFNNIDAGFVAGGGLNLSYVKLGFQYTYGLTNVVRDEEDLDLRNGVFQFVVRWKFYSEIRNAK